MSRGRFISKRIGKSDKVSDVRTMHARFLYVICYTNVDVEGRCTANPIDIYDDFLGHKMRKKYSPLRIQEYLENLHDVGLIILYEAKGKRFMEFVDFHEHQIGLRKDREAPSFIPAPPKNLRKKSQLRSYSGVDPELREREDKEKAKEEEKTKEEEESPSGDSRPREYLIELDVKNTLIKWNGFASEHSLPKIKDISGTRRRHLLARIKSKKDPFIIEEILEIIKRCPFLLGKTKAEFRLFFDWIILPSNFQKIIEGNYIDKKFSSYKSYLLKKRKQGATDDGQ